MPYWLFRVRAMASSKSFTWISEDDRSEDLFSGNGHVGMHIVEDGGTYIVTLLVTLDLHISSVEDQLCPLLNPLLDVA